MATKLALTLVAVVVLAGAFLALRELTARSAQQDVSAVVGDTLDEAGTASIEGDTIVVMLDSGPVALVPNSDTRFFVCEQQDACDEVEEQAFRDSVTPGAPIRILGPNAELITPDATELPEAVWVVLDATG